MRAPNTIDRYRHTLACAAHACVQTSSSRSRVDRRVYTRDCACVEGDKEGLGDRGRERNCKNSGGRTGKKGVAL